MNRRGMLHALAIAAAVGGGRFVPGERDASAPRKPKQVARNELPERLQILRLARAEAKRARRAEQRKGSR